MNAREIAIKVQNVCDHYLSFGDKTDFEEMVEGLGFESPVEYYEANLKVNNQFVHNLIADIIRMSKDDESTLATETISDLIDFGIERDLEEASAECVEAGYPSHGYNYGLRADSIQKWWRESYPEYY